MPDPDKVAPKTAGELGRILTGPLFDVVIASGDFTPRQKDILEKTKKGVPLGGSLGIGRSERDAIFLHACRLMRSGRHPAAYELLRFLFLLHPTDARVAYTLAMALQLYGLYSNAADVYLYFVALDATNPDGHLRMAECSISLERMTDARDHLLIAMRYAKTDEQRDLADRLMASIDGDRSTAGRAPDLDDKPMSPLPTTPLPERLQ